MITLTTPHQINSVLGGNAPIQYNKLVLGPFQMNQIDKTISGVLKLTSTTNPDMQAILGKLRILVNESSVEVEVPQLDFYRRIVTSVGQNNSITSIIETAQAQLENGLINLGIIAGARSAGV
jgi:hypothetical protein